MRMERLENIMTDYLHNFSEDPPTQQFPHLSGNKRNQSYISCSGKTISESTLLISQVAAWAT